MPDGQSHNAVAVPARQVAHSTSCVISSRHAEQTPDADTGYLCFDCYGRLRKTLQQLPAIAGWLHANLAAGGVAGERVAGTREDPIPLRQDVLDLIGPDSRHYVAGDAQPVFLLWEDGVALGAYPSWVEASDACHAEMVEAGVSKAAADLFRLNAPTDEYPTEILDEVTIARSRWQIRPTERGGGDQRGLDSIVAVLFSWARLVEAEGHFGDWPTGADVAAFAGFLAGHMSWIAEQPWVDDFYDETHRLSSEAHRIAPWRAETRRDPEPCGCGVRAVVWHIAEGFTRCERSMGGCGREQKVTEHAMNANLPETRKAAG